ncbi:hypothetical protein [Kitasatospora sp. NPDC002040]|uniref:hypothetical protein n=1 Tax=Kitasatospora sp. NPDC002040 TaxID=3154661 RepID=UPI003317B6A8
MSEDEGVPNGRQNHQGVVRIGPVRVLACLAGLVLGGLVLVGFTDEARAALWGKPGTVTDVKCRAYSNPSTSGGESTYCSGSFTPDGSSSSFEVDVEEKDVSIYPLHAWLAGGTSGTAYVSPSVWTGVLPVGFALLAGGLPLAALVGRARSVRAQRAGGRLRGPDPEQD